MKKGETVVKILDIGGSECAVIGRVTEVKKGVVAFEDDDSLRYDARTGREIDPAPGFAAMGISSRLVRVDGAQ